MDFKCKMIMEEYLQKKPDFIQLCDTVGTVLREMTDESHIKTVTIETRVKTEKSLAGKLELKGEKYSSLADITDIMGGRIVCFFSDDVDRIAENIKEIFVIDEENSVDKRKAINPDSFGYLSLHFICSLPDNGKWPSNICGLKFEIQVRTNLQHTWAVINHDIGYKSQFGVPRTVVRGFSQVASLLEIADQKFMDLRDELKAYSDDVRSKIADDDADDLAIDRISLSEYMRSSRGIQEFLGELAALCVNCEISYVSPDPYLEQLKFLGIRTLGDLRAMLERNRSLALRLAGRLFESTDLDILSTNSALRFLCRAELITGCYSPDQMTDFMMLSYGDRAKSEKQVKRLVMQCGEYD